MINLFLSVTAPHVKNNLVTSNFLMSQIPHWLRDTVISDTCVYLVKCRYQLPCGVMVYTGNVRNIELLRGSIKMEY